MRREHKKNIALLILCAVIVPLAMAPKPQPVKINVGPIAVTKGNKKLNPEITLRVIEDRDGSDGLVRQIVYDPGGPLWQILSDGSSQYLHEDPRGNIVMLSEGAGSPMAATGDVLERVTYDPYGKPVFQDAGNQNKTDGGGNFLARSDFGNTLLYMGRWYDPETGSRARTLSGDRGGLYDFGGRFLNPDEGRFITRAGPAGEEIHPDEYGRVKVQFSSSGANRYGFAGHAPVNAAGGRGNFKTFTVTKPDFGTRSKKLFVGGLAWTTGSSAGKPELNEFTIEKKTDAAFTPGGKFELKVWGDPKEFQKKKKMLVDGVVGPQTWGLVTFEVADMEALLIAAYNRSGDDMTGGRANSPEWTNLNESDPGVTGSGGADVGVTITDDPDPVLVGMLVPAVQTIRDSGAGGGGSCCGSSCSCPPPPPECCGASCSC